MTPLIFLKAIIPLSLLIFVAENDAAVTRHHTEDRSRRVVIDFVPRCCLVPSCKREGWVLECQNILNCGSICEQDRYPSVNHIPTPGYKLKKFYYGNQCYNGECQQIKKSCVPCEEPSDPKFSIYTIPSYCHECYCKNC